MPINMAVKIMCLVDEERDWFLGFSHSLLKQPFSAFRLGGHFHVRIAGDVEEQRCDQGGQYNAGFVH